MNTDLNLDKRYMQVFISVNTKENNVWIWFLWLDNGALLVASYLEGPDS